MGLSSFNRARREAVARAEAEAAKNKIDDLRAAFEAEYQAEMAEYEDTAQAEEPKTKSKRAKK